MTVSIARTKVAIVIPVYNRRDTTLQCLRSLERANLSDLEVMIYVIDDASTDGTGDMVREWFPDVVLIEGTGTLHYAAGTNRGLSAAMQWGPDYLVTMNDDAVFHRGFLQHLIETARSEKRSIVGSLLLLWDEPHRVFQVAPKWNTMKGGWVIPENLTIASMGAEPFKVEVIVGNCVLFPRNAIEECGFLDEKNFPNGWGDAQYTVRMRKKGWELFVDPRSFVWCEPNTNLPPLHQNSFRKQLNTLFVDSEHPINLKRQFVARWHSAPTHISACFSFVAYVSAMFRKALYYKFREHSKKGRVVPNSVVV